MKFSKDRKPNRDVVFAEPRSRTVNGATGEKGPWEASWSWVTVVVSYDENDDLHDIQVIGVPSRRPASGPEDRPEPNHSKACSDGVSKTVNGGGRGRPGNRVTKRLPE